MNVSVSITDGATPALRNAVDTLTFRRAAKAAGQALRIQIRKHLAAKQRLPNKKNWPKQNWFQRARERVVFVEDSRGAAISIDFPGFAMRYTGNPSVILPVNAKTLAIPMHPMAYGRRPREFKDLLFVPVLRGRTVGLLAMRVGNGPATVWINLYRLVKYVRTKADKSILPTDEEMKAEATAAIIDLASTVV